MAYIRTTKLSKAINKVSKETNQNLLFSQYDSTYFSQRKNSTVKSLILLIQISLRPTPERIFVRKILKYF